MNVQLTTRLADIPDAASYAEAANNLIDRSLNAIAMSRFASGRTFVNSLKSCPVFSGQGVELLCSVLAERYAKRTDAA